MHREFPVDPVLEAGYNIRLLRSDFDDVIAGWSARSAALRENADTVPDCAYGKGARDKLDIFRCDKADAPLFVFVHGGYWQRGDKSIYSFVAEPFLEAGVDVALIGYELCPSTSMEMIVSKIRSAVAWIWRNAADLGVSANRINLSGHSAGGHLTAMLLATSWPDTDADLPIDLIKSGIPISGLYQLEPIRRTTIADALGLTTDATARISPHFLKPVTDAPVLVAVGGGETPDFHWQADEFVARWHKLTPSIDHHVEPDADHFGVIDRLADRDSMIFKKTRDWLR